MTFDTVLQLLVIAYGVLGILCLLAAVIMAVVVFVKIMKGVR